MTANLSLNNYNQNLIDLTKKDEITTLQTTVETVEDRVYLVESYNNGASWYRIYSDGWCEQGGINTTGTTATGTIDVSQTLLVPYADTNYNVLATANYIGCYIAVYTTGKTTSKFVGNVCHRTGTATAYYLFTWRAAGYIE